MGIKVVKKRPCPAVRASRVGGRSTFRTRSMPPPGSGSHLKWVVVGIVAVMAVVVLLAVAAVNQANRETSGTGVRFVYGEGESAQRPARDSITASMGGKSMKEWCAQNDKDNEMVQQRRARRRGL